MIFRRAMLLVATSVAMTGATFAIPAAANAAVSGCSYWKSSTISVSAYCKTVTTPSSYRAKAFCHKGGSFPQDAITYGEWSTPIWHITSVARCAAGFVVTGGGIEIKNP